MYTILLLLFSLTFFQGDRGCAIDPNGGCTAATLGDEGSGLDPHGGVNTLSDEGNGLDPHGTPRALAGPRMDPNGGGGAMDPNG